MDNWEEEGSRSRERERDAKGHKESGNKASNPARRAKKKQKTSAVGLDRHIWTSVHMYVGVCAYKTPLNNDS